MSLKLPQPRVDDKFIDAKYDVEHEKKTIDEFNYIGDLELDFHGMMTTEIFKELLDSRLEKFKDATHLKFENWGYDGGETINIYKTTKRLETTRETYERLKNWEREERKRLKGVDEARNAIMAHYNI